jgi:hypothetical protein
MERVLSTRGIDLKMCVSVSKKTVKTAIKKEYSDEHAVDYAQ